MVGAAMVVPDGVCSGVLGMLKISNENVAVAAYKVGRIANYEQFKQTLQRNERSNSIKVTIGVTVRMKCHWCHYTSTRYKRIRDLCYVSVAPSDLCHQEKTLRARPP